jgi:hypothetical protein
MMMLAMAGAQPVNPQTVQGPVSVTCDNNVSIFKVGQKIVGKGRDCTEFAPGPVFSKKFKTGEQVILVQSADGWMANGAAIRIAPKEPPRFVYFQYLAEFTGIMAANRIGYAGQANGEAFSCEATVNWTTGKIVSNRKTSKGGDFCGKW